jgi:carbamoyl-phosphate synthase large subunit
MNVLLTCAGRRNYIVDYFREALHNIGGKVYAANSTPDSTALIVADKGFIVPSLYDPTYLVPVGKPLGLMEGQAGCPESHSDG